MKTLIMILVFSAAFFLIGYGIKRYFDYKILQGKEGSNATIRKAIGSLLFGLIALVSIAPLIADIIVQILNKMPGVSLKNTQSGEIIGLIAYVVFCIAIIAVIRIYYQNRNKLYDSEPVTNKKSRLDSKPVQPSVKNPDKKVSNNNQQVINHGSVGKQININENNGEINL